MKSKFLSIRRGDEAKTSIANQFRKPSEPAARDELQPLQPFQPISDVSNIDSDLVYADCVQDSSRIPRLRVRQGFGQASCFGRHTYPGGQLPRVVFYQNLCVVVLTTNKSLFLKIASTGILGFPRQFLTTKGSNFMGTSWASPEGWDRKLSRPAGKSLLPV